MQLISYSAEVIERVLTPERAIVALEAALTSGLDPEEDSPRLFSPFPNEGEFILMPAKGRELSGIKVLTAAPGNPAQGLPKIQGIYTLFDSSTAAPIAVIDAVSLTAIRTPAVALTAVKHLARLGSCGERPTVLTFGAGVQALNHIRAARTVFPDASFEVVGRSVAPVKRLIDTLAAEGIAVTDRCDDPEDAVRGADIILCCTSSDTPLFDGALPKDTAIIAATGTHGRHRREIDSVLAARADIVVESRGAALRESGNLGDLPEGAHESWWNIRDLVLGSGCASSPDAVALQRTPGRPALYSGVGMSWEDLVVAEVVYREG